MTQLTDLLEKGYRIQISEQVEPDTVFAFADQGVHQEGDMLVFHPLNYSYLAYEDPFVAHERNMAYIQAKIELMARDALIRLDRMVDEMHDRDRFVPQTIVFLPNTDVIENEDGSFTFIATPAEGFGDYIVDPNFLDRTRSDKYIKEYENG